MQDYANSTAAALVFSRDLEGAYLRAVVGWSVAIADQACGWTCKPEKGGCVVVLKKPSKRHGFNKDRDGEIVPDDKGRAQRHV